MNLTALVPLPYRALALALLAAALLGFGWLKGAEHVQDKWDAADVRNSQTTARISVKQAAATVQLVTRYVDRIQKIRVAGATIKKKVPIYVPVETDAACILTRGFVRLHDAAAAGQLPGPAGDPDAAPAGIALSAVADTVADNYERCHENSAQLIALQEWVLEMKRIDRDERADH